MRVGKGLSPLKFAEICENCGEYNLSDEITEQLMQRAEEALLHGAEVEIVRFAA